MTERIKYNRLINKIIVVSVIVLLFSCAKEESENINQDSIYTMYSLFYNQSTKTTIVKATFRIGGESGTRLELSNPAIVTFNGVELDYRSRLGEYRKEYYTLLTSGIFVYKDLDNNTFTNIIPTMNTIGFPSLNTISSGSDFHFTWIGEPLAEHETISLKIRAVGDSDEIFICDTEGATEFVLPAHKLQNVGTGNRDCDLERTFFSDNLAETTTKGGSVEVSYSISKSINISSQ